jgi:hypothetical protein
MMSCIKEFSIKRFFLKDARIVGISFLLLTASTMAFGQSGECTLTPGGDEPPYPHKVGDLYDQGNSPSCAFTSLLNANIRAGADDTNGKFFKALKTCLNKRGYPGIWVGREPSKPDTGASTAEDSPEGAALRDCKREIMAAQQPPKMVTLTTFSLIPGIDDFVTVTANPTPTSDICEKIRSALAAGGSAVVSTFKGTLQKPVDSHSSTVSAIICDHSTPKATITLLDPNNPGSPITLEVDKSGKMTPPYPPSTPSHYQDAQIYRGTIEQ